MYMYTSAFTHVRVRAIDCCELLLCEHTLVRSAFLQFIHTCLALKLHGLNVYIHIHMYAGFQLKQHDTLCFSP